MKKCENCKNKHDGSYGTGRFCTQKCSRSFATKNKRQEINKKVSSKLKKPSQLISATCEYCKQQFTYDFKIKKIKRKFCSRKCSFSSVCGLPKKFSNTSRMGGLRPGGGHSILCEYSSLKNGKIKLNKDEIEVVKIFDSFGLNWERNIKGFMYEDMSGKQRKFYPDFYLSDFNVYVEYKGWITEEMKHKMNDSINKNKDLNLIIIFGDYPKNYGLGINFSQIKNKVFLLNLLERYTNGK